MTHLPLHAEPLDVLLQIGLVRVLRASFESPLPVFRSTLKTCTSSILRIRNRNDAENYWAAAVLQICHQKLWSNYVETNQKRGPQRQTTLTLAHLHGLDNSRRHQPPDIYGLLANLLNRSIVGNYVRHTHLHGEAGGVYACVL